ncbi:ATP-binding protein [Streptomyces sp. NPDC006703]|uniref:ATP-binding protein n=1 Tax=Streptomyces sp. NPDC006703 TaxID=3364759 RepID=UPI0036A2D196
MTATAHCTPIVTVPCADGIEPGDKHVFESEEWFARAAGRGEPPTDADNRWPALCRRSAVDMLDRWGLARFSPVAELLVSELVTNAVQHGVGPIGFRLVRRRRTIKVEVADRGMLPFTMRLARVDDERGRGLTLVEALSDGWGVRGDRDGRCRWVWASLTTASPGEW